MVRGPSSGFLLLCLGAWQFAACAPTLPETDMSPTRDSESAHADVLSVRVDGQPGAYQFAVEIASPDTGCDQYADWWEVVSIDGELLYRRILLHSHVDEQPFTRSGGPVSIAADTLVWVRAHMNTGVYGGAVLRGSPRDGFAPVEAQEDLFPDLERTPPRPGDCAF